MIFYARISAKVLILCATLFMSASLFAQVLAPSESVDTSKILQRLQAARPDLNFTDLESSPVKGLYKVKINGQLTFVDQTGEFLIAGDMYQLKGNQLVNLQEIERKEAEKAFEPERAKLLAAVQKEDMVIYSPEEVKGHVYIFTDIDCGYCRRIHSQMDAILAKGIEVRYLGFPRAGVESNSANKLATVWCSEKPQEMMDRFKRGENVALNPCFVNPISDQYALGRQVGVNGTPAIVLPNGQMIPGAVSPDHLANALGI